MSEQQQQKQKQQQQQEEQQFPARETPKISLPQSRAKVVLNRDTIEEEGKVNVHQLNKIYELLDEGASVSEVANRFRIDENLLSSVLKYVSKPKLEGPK